MTQRCDALEKSQDLISKKYDTVIETIQKSNGQTTKLDKKYKEITNLIKQKHTELAGTMAGTTDKYEEPLSNRMLTGRNTTLLKKRLLGNYRCANHTP